jgi:hypothetical protein
MLEALVAAELAAPAEPGAAMLAARQLADDILAQHQAGVEAVLFYGACRLDDDPTGLLDLYVLTRATGHFIGVGCRRCSMPCCRRRSALAQRRPRRPDPCQGGGVDASPVRAAAAAGIAGHHDLGPLLPTIDPGPCARSAVRHRWNRPWRRP